MGGTDASVFINLLPDIQGDRKSMKECQGVPVASFFCRTTLSAVIPTRHRYKSG